jgi:uncharacterized protein with PQ loop repeat
MLLPKIISILAPIFDVFHRIPQLHKTYKTKKVKHFSFYSLALLFITSTLWLVHGYFIFDMSLIISGAAAVLMDIILVILYITHS